MEFINHSVAPIDFFRMRVLHDGGIRQAIKSGLIQSDKAIPDSQIQPGSLDVRIGQVKVYDKEVMRKNVLFYDKYGTEPGDRFAIRYPDAQGRRILIPPGSFFEVYFHEELDCPDYDLSFELRSSRGRLAIQPTSGIGRVEEDAESRRFVSLWNKNPDPIILYGQTPFLQLFFHPHDDVPYDGEVVTDRARIREISDLIFDSPVDFLNGFAVLTAGEHVIKLKQTYFPLDTNEKNEDHYEKISLENPVFIGQDEPYICQVAPKMKLPPTIGVQILRSIPFLQGHDLPMFMHDNHCVNAGWVDAGYDGHATAHLYRGVLPTELKKGDPVALAIIYEYLTPVERPYGSKELNSHYQNSKGDASRS
jgi:deoxycytidine triphosphate deaminase